MPVYYFDNSWKKDAPRPKSDDQSLECLVIDWLEIRNEAPCGNIGESLGKAYSATKGVRNDLGHNAGGGDVSRRWL